jgi:putative FmdB family regulatory protein
MPTYEYRREDGSTFEIMQRITDAPLETCPTTGQKVTRAIGGGTGLIFKGSGFYLTDYARKNGNGSSSSPKAAGTDSKVSDSKSTADSSSGSKREPAK